MIIKNALVFTLDQGFVNKEVKIKDGRFFSILDDEARMIDVTEIDECSIGINKLFDKLMDIKESIDEGQ